LDQASFSASFISDVASVLNISQDSIQVLDIKSDISKGTLVKFTIANSAKNRTLLDIATDLYHDISNTSSDIYQQVTTQDLDSHYYYVSLIFLGFEEFLRLPTAIIAVIMTILPLLIIGFFVLHKKYFPQANNLIFLSALVGVVSFAMNIWFLKFLKGLPFHDLQWVFIFLLTGLLSSSVLNFTIVSYVLKKELITNKQFKEWVTAHLNIVYLIHLLSILNTQNGHLWTSELLGLESFSAPMSEEMQVQLKFYSLISIILGDGIVLSSQIYVSIYLNTFFTPSSLAFIFTGLNIIAAIIVRSLAHVKQSQAKKSIEFNREVPSPSASERSEEGIITPEGRQDFNML